MASPFRYFRKYGKVMMAVFVVVLMLSWVIGDSLSSLFGGKSQQGPVGGGGSKPNEVAVSWNGGSLTNAQLHTMRTERQVLNGFLYQLNMQGARTALAANVEPSKLSVDMLIETDDERQLSIPEESVVETKLFADAARAAGMRVSDDAVAQYLDKIGRGRVPRPEMSEILTQMTQRAGVSNDGVINALRDVMLARNYLKSNSFAWLAQTPDQRWDDWLRVNERVIIEAAAITTDSLLADVKDPTDAELEAFYKKVGEDGLTPDKREPNPDFERYVELPSASPAFRIPRKIDVAYIEANYDSYVEAAKAKVTEEEIKKYYDDHKDPLFIKADVNLLDDKDKDKVETKDAAKPEGETKPEADAKNESDAKKDEKDAPAAPAGKDDAKENKDDAKKDAEKDEKKSSLKTADSPFRLVAFQENEKDAAAKKDDEAKKDDSAQKDAAAQKDAPAATNPAAGKAGADLSPKTGLPSLGGLDLSAPIITAPVKPKVFRSLDEVKDEIRRNIASEKAATELNELMGKVLSDLDGAFGKYTSDVLAAEEAKKPKPEPPKELTDLKVIAEKNGLKSGSTGPLAAVQFRDTPVGKTSVVDMNQPLLRFLYGPTPADMYQPYLTEDIDGNRFIVMKTSDTPGRNPPLADVKEEVKKAWKLAQAAELAKKKAEELAKKANEAKTPLAKFFEEDKAIKVVQTDPFAEFSGGDIGIINNQLGRQPYKLSQPKDIVAPGPDFMKEVFKLQDGQVGVAMNHNRSVAYVVRMVEHTPPLAELRSAYLTEANNWPGLPAMTQEHYTTVVGGVTKSFRDATQLDWKRPHDAKRSAGETSEESGE